MGFVSSQDMCFASFCIWRIWTDMDMFGSQDRTRAASVIVQGAETQLKVSAACRSRWTCGLGRAGSKYLVSRSETRAESTCDRKITFMHNLQLLFNTFQYFSTCLLVHFNKFWFCRHSFTAFNCCTLECVLRVSVPRKAL